MLLELLGTDFTDVAKDVSQRTIIGIAALRLLFNAQLRMFEIVCFNPGDVTRRGVCLTWIDSNAGIVFTISK